MKKGAKWQQHSWTIEKEGGAEARYDLSTESHLHGWGPKLAACYFIMNLKETFKFYWFLSKKHHPTEAEMPLKECIHKLTHHSLTYFNKMMIWEREALELHLVLLILLQPLLIMTGRNIWLDADWEPFSSPTAGAVHVSTPLLMSLVVGVSRYCAHLRNFSSSENKPFRMRILCTAHTRKHCLLSWWYCP